MDDNDVGCDKVIAELIEMGFKFSNVKEAIKAVGPSLDDAIEFILNGSCIKSTGAASSSKCSTSSTKAMGRRASTKSFGRIRQLSIMERLRPEGTPKRAKITAECDILVSGPEVLSRPLEKPNELPSVTGSSVKATPDMLIIPSHCKEEDVGPDWEAKSNNLLHKHFGYSSLKAFQKEALAAWLAHQDCLVLAATGSGKSLCFQIPALLTGKVVVVISPLISLMHDQCFRLAKHGVSACFLGSGQTDRSVEEKAMRGMYDIIYVCPETILRLIKALQGLAGGRGIALFAIDEVHCVSKWGHDFRPDYRRLSVLRENFKAEKLKCLTFDIPLMALTATATIRVREDILKSLCMSEDTRIVLTSFFRPNLRFSVKHSRTSSPSSYENDFHELIDLYNSKEDFGKRYNHISQDVSKNSSSTYNGGIYDVDGTHKDDMDSVEDDPFSENEDEVSSPKENTPCASKQRKMSVEYLEDDCDLFLGGDDLDVSCSEFFGQPPIKDWSTCESFETDLQNRPDERLNLLQMPSEQGLTIIYVPTRKETLRIAKFLSKFGVKAAAYNAKLPKSHLRNVLKEFHENALQVVVATIAFGMGIDKLDVRRIIHYGWPQSLEAYYQEAGRAGRDGKLADCVLYANLSRMPTLLPSTRSRDQTKQAYRMLSDCFRYGMCTTSCRAKTLVQYFGEEFSHKKCLLCDVCVNGPPEVQNLKTETEIFMQVIADHYGKTSYVDKSYDDDICNSSKQRINYEKPNIKVFVSKIRQRFQQFMETDMLWWRGLARILEDKGFIREGDDMNHVQIKFPEPTELGLDFLRSNSNNLFHVYPEADMLLSTIKRKPYSTFAEWGKGWADPEIRRQRLERKRSWKSPRKRKSSKWKPDMGTVRGRLAAKFSKLKR